MVSTDEHAHPDTYTTSCCRAICDCCTGSIAPSVEMAVRFVAFRSSSAYNLSAMREEAGGWTGMLPRLDTMSRAVYGRWI